MKKLLFVSITTLYFSANMLYAAPQFKPGKDLLVDGVSNSTQTVITSRQPLFSWEYEGVVSSFTMVVSTDSIFQASGEMWNYTGTTTTANTINDITRVEYNADGAAALLAADKTYYWQVSIFNGAGDTDSGYFTTTNAAVTLPGSKYDLAVDWNNPFDPSANQITKFRFTAKDRDRKMQLRVFTVSGELVREWPEQTVMKDAVYTETWDGKNSNNETVARGIYLVNLVDVGDDSSVTRKVAVINGDQ